MQNLPKEKKLPELSEQDQKLLMSDLFTGLLAEGEKNDMTIDLDIKVLDSFFQAATDPYKYKDTIMQAMPIFARALMPNVDTKTLLLLSGLVTLF